MPRPARKPAKSPSKTLTQASHIESQKESLSDQENLPFPKTPSSGSPRYGRRSITSSNSSFRRLSFSPKKVFDGLVDDLSPVKPLLKSTLPTPPRDENEVSGDSSDEFDIDTLVLKSSTKKRRQTRVIKSPTPAKKTRASAKLRKSRTKSDDIWTAAGYVDDVDGYELIEETIKY
ncbi:hypothetical protein IWW36_004562 [Coemansia brasiliensis]|uniref:Uncharacterized protein n=1 Tax=Coemansia brasiliensis TaxID=2650707 RepID=A0A9W8IBX5_9FUNG|nr:hypothetical protein IWW36_004562 [Coemansia brasiliensis]